MKINSRAATSNVEIKNDLVPHSLLRLRDVVTYYVKANAYYIYHYTLSTIRISIITYELNLGG
jgi:hypothetical protein